MNEVLAALDIEFEALYRGTGRQSIAPERLLRASLLQAFYTVRRQTACVRRFLPAMMGGGTRGRGPPCSTYEAARVHHTAWRRGGGVAARGARAAAGNAGHRLPDKPRAKRPT